MTIVYCEGPHPDPIPPASVFGYVFKGQKSKKVILCDACAEVSHMPIVGKLPQ